MTDRFDAVLLLGPTASGKSAVAMALAHTRAVEIVSVDSALVYRGMDIGTAKPSREDRQRVPHHLIDLIDPIQRYSAAAFADDARRLIPAIHARDAEAAEHGWPALHARLAALDPATAARLEPGDSQRIQRALEVIRTTGRPLSEQLGARTVPADAPRLLTIALEPSDRAVLHARIDARFRAMLAAGFVDEVRALRARGDLHPSLPSMRCVGYRQAWSWLDDLQRGDRSDTRRDAFVAQGIAATRQLAKRQLTWLRSMPERIVVDALAPDVATRVSAIIAAHER